MNATTARLKAVLAGFVIGVGAVYAGPAPGPELVAALAAKAAAVKSYRADMTIEMQMMGQSMVSKGQMTFKQPGKTRMETVMKMGGMEMKQINVVDGTTAWTHQPAMNMVTRIDLKKVAEATGNSSAMSASGDVSRPFQPLKEDTIEYLRSDTVGDTAVHVFEGRPQMAGAGNAGAGMMPAKLQLWIGAADGMVRKTIMFNAAGTPMMTQTFTNVRINTEVPDSLFTFTPPAGAQVMDMTEGTLNMMRQMQQAPAAPAAE